MFATQWLNFASQCCLSLFEMFVHGPHEPLVFCKSVGCEAPTACAASTWLKHGSVLARPVSKTAWVATWGALGCSSEVSHLLHPSLHGIQQGSVEGFWEMDLILGSFWRCIAQPPIRNHQKAPLRGDHESPHLLFDSMATARESLN